MTEFWAHLAPWLLMAVALPAGILASLAMRPSDEWAGRVIEAWAESSGLRVEAIEEPRWSWTSSLSRAYRVRVRDEDGRERECRAVVGRLLLGRTARGVVITWIEPRPSHLEAG